MAKKLIDDTDDVVDPGAAIRFLNYIANKVTTLIAAIDTQVNILVGTSAAIFVFATSRVAGENTSFSSLILSIFAGLATIICLLAVHPPRIFRGRQGAEGLMNIHGIEKYADEAAYAKELKKVVEDKDKIVDQYSFEIYKRAKYYYRPKRRLYRLARNILLLGIIFGLLGYLIDVFARPMS